MELKGFEEEAVVVAILEFEEVDVVVEEEEEVLTEVEEVVGVVLK